MALFCEPARDGYRGRHAAAAVGLNEQDAEGPRHRGASVGASVSRRSAYSSHPSTACSAAMPDRNTSNWEPSGNSRAAGSISSSRRSVALFWRLML